MKRRILAGLIAILGFYFLSLSFPKITLADTCDFRTEPPIPYTTGDEIKLIFDVSGFTERNFLCSFPGTMIGNPPAQKLGADEVFCTSIADVPEIRTVELLHPNKLRACVANFTIHLEPCEISIEDPTGKWDINSRFDIEITKIHPYGDNLSYYVQIKKGTLKELEWEGRQSSTFLQTGVGPFPPGTHKVIVINEADSRTLCERSFEVVDVGRPPAPTRPPVKPFDPCWDEEKKEYNPDCVKCLGDPLPDGTRKNAAEKSWTALGCLPTEPADFVGWLLSAAIKIGGGIAFLLMLFGGFQIMTSAGDPEKLNQGKSIITSALAGLLFIIFSVLILKIIGIDILQLPDFLATPKPKG